MNAFIDTFIERGPAPVPRMRGMTIVAQDPSVVHCGRIVRAEVQVPADRLEAGPRSHRFHVVDYDGAAGRLEQAADLTDPLAPPVERTWTYLDRFAGADDATLVDDPAFHAQNVYAIAARTLAAFEFALGRRVEWAFGGHQLYLVPHAFAEANAHYSGEDPGVVVGRVELAGRGTINTCLSHDILCHEVTHAILDRLRPHF